MKTKYVVLNNGLGIGIMLDIEECKDKTVLPDDIFTSGSVFIRLKATVQNFINSTEMFYLKRGFSDIVTLINDQIKSERICFEINDISFDEAHFQEEALYCAIQDWVSKYYKIPVILPAVIFDEIHRRFIFDVPDFNAGR